MYTSLSAIAMALYEESSSRLRVQLVVINKLEFEVLHISSGPHRKDPGMLMQLRGAMQGLLAH